MAVTFDAVGPSSAGAAVTGSTSLSWSHTCAGTDRLLLVDVTVSDRFENINSIAVTYAAVAMTSIGRRNSNDQTQGFVERFRLVAPAVGANTVAVTIGVAKDMTGGSMSFAGVDQTNPLGALVSEISATTSVAAQVTDVVAGELVAAAACCGGPISSAGSGMSLRWLRNLNSASGAGNGAAATSAATGSVTVSFERGSSEWWALLACRVRAAGGGAPPAVTGTLAVTLDGATAAASGPPLPPPAAETPAIPAPVTRADREAMLSASSVECWLERLDVLDENEVFQRDIVDRCLALRVRHDGFAQVHREVEFTIEGELDWGRARVSPWVRVAGGGFADVVQLGVFCVTKRVPSRDGTPSLHTVSGMDKGYLLHHPIRRAVSYPKGAPILAAVVDLLFQRGVTATRIDPARGGRLLKEARTWAIADGVTYLEVINQLLEMVSYRGLTFTADGFAQSQPLISPAAAPVVWRYDTADPATIVHREGGGLEDNLLEAFNDWVLWANDEEREDPPVPGDGLFTHTNQLSGLSSVDARGGLVISRVEGVEAATQEDLDSVAAQVVASDMVANRDLAWQSDVNPYHGHQDVVELLDRDLGFVGRVQQVSWELDPFARVMVHTARGVEGAVLTSAPPSDADVPAPIEGFFVAGGADSLSAVDLGAVITAQTGWTVFTLGDGWFQGLTVTRAGITVQAQHSRQAQFTGGITLSANDIRIDGFKRDAGGGTATMVVNNPGCTVHDCEVRNFGKAAYATGIFIPETALDASNPILVDHCLVDDYGQNVADWFGAGIAVGLQDGTDASHYAPYTAPNGRGVRVMHCTVTNGPTLNLPYAAGIQVLHPTEIGYNYVAGVHNSPLQVKAGNCWIHHNEVTNPGITDGCLYNRAWSDNNLWEYNYVHDSPLGIDHFQGDLCTYRHNVFDGCAQWLRVKEDNDDGTAGPGLDAGTDSMVLSRNTVYDVTGTPAWFWDTAGPGVISNVDCDNNVFSELDGAVVSTAAPYSAVSGAGNVFHNVVSTQANVGGTVANPQLANPAAGDFTVTNGTYADGAPGAAGAAWPFPVGPQ